MIPRRLAALDRILQRAVLARAGLALRSLDGPLALLVMVHRPVPDEGPPLASIAMRRSGLDPVGGHLYHVAAFPGALRATRGSVTDPRPGALLAALDMRDAYHARRLLCGLCGLPPASGLDDWIRAHPLAGPESILRRFGPSRGDL